MPPRTYRADANGQRDFSHVRPKCRACGGSLLDKTCRNQYCPRSPFYVKSLKDLEKETQCVKSK